VASWSNKGGQLRLYAPLFSVSINIVVLKAYSVSLLLRTVQFDRKLVRIAGSYKLWKTLGRLSKMDQKLSDGNGWMRRVVHLS
jgi:hypothetical protein